MDWWWTYPFFVGKEKAEAPLFTGLQLLCYWSE